MPVIYWSRRRFLAGIGEIGALQSRFRGQRIGISGVFCVEALRRMWGQIQCRENQTSGSRGSYQNASEPLKNERKATAVIDASPKPGHEIRRRAHFRTSRSILQPEFIEMAIGFRHPLSLPDSSKPQHSLEQNL